MATIDFYCTNCAARREFTVRLIAEYIEYKCPVCKETFIHRVPEPSYNRGRVADKYQ